MTVDDRAVLDGLRLLTAALITATDAAEVGEIVSTHLARSFDADCAYIVTLDDASGQLHLVGQVGLVGGTADAFPLPVTAGVPVSDAVRLESPLWFSSAAEMQERYPDLDPATLPAAAAAAIPLRYRGRTLGAVSLGLGAGRGWTDPATSLALAVADLTALALGATAAEAGTDATVERRLAERGEELRRLKDADLIGIVSGVGMELREANRRFLKLVGREGHDLAAQPIPVAELLAPGYDDLAERAAQAVQDTGTAPNLEIELVSADGQRIPVLVGAVLLPGDDMRWVAYVADMTDRERAARRARLLLQLGEALSPVSTVADIADTLDGDVITGIGAFAGGLLMADPETESLVPVGRIGSAGVLDPVPLSSWSPTADAFRTGTPTFVGSADELLARYPGLGRQDQPGPAAAWAALPIDGPEGDPVAVLVLRYPRSRHFGPEERSFKLALSTLVSQALSRVLLAERREAARIAGAMDAMVDSVAVMVPEHDEVGAIVDFRFEYLNSASLDGFGRRAEDLLGARLREEYPVMAGGELFDAYVEVIRTGEPLVVDSYNFVGAGPDGDVPLSYSLRASRYGADRLIVTWRDVTERERTAAELRKSRSELEAAQRLAGIGNWRVDLATGEMTWSQQLYRILGLDEHTDPPTIEWARHHFIAAAGRDVSLIDEEVLSSSGPVQIETTLRRADGDVRDIVLVVEVERDAEGRPVAAYGTTQDITDRRRAEEALAAAEQELIREQATILALQDSILPRHLPERPDVILGARYLPAAPRAGVGGDWYDAFDLPDGRLAVVVGDVAGHGVGAAADMAHLRNALRAYAVETASPGEVLTRLNRLLDGANHATCVIAMLRPHTGELVVGRAGHPPPLRLHPHGRTTWIRTETAPPLGAVRGTTYDSVVTSLEPGDAVVLFTDGLVERRGESIDVGLDRLRRSAEARVGLAPGVLLDELVEEQVGDQQRFDDICVLALRLVPGGGG